MPHRTRRVEVVRRRKKFLSREDIHSFCGIFKLKPGEKSVVQELLEEHREEKELEERKFQRLSALGKK